MTFFFCLQKSGGILFRINENKWFDTEHFVLVPNASQVSRAFAKYTISHHKVVAILICLVDTQDSRWIYSYEDISVIHKIYTIDVSRVYYSENNTDQQTNGEHCMFYLTLKLDKEMEYFSLGRKIKDLCKMSCKSADFCQSLGDGFGYSWLLWNYMKRGKL